MMRSAKAFFLGGRKGKALAVEAHGRFMSFIVVAQAVLLEFGSGGGSTIERNQRNVTEASAMASIALAA